MAYQQTLPTGTVLIEEFRIEGHLGSGGFANTYLAMDLTLGREVAIKEYFPSELAVRHNSSRVEVRSSSHGAQFEWALGRFVREAKTLAKFRHPSVVRVFRVFNANDTAYIVLEFVRGSNMEAWLKGLGRRPTQAELDELLPPMLDALEVVHSAGILHRDIKPANIYIRAADHTPVLLDFGAARYAAGDYAGTTAAIVSKGYSPHEAYATDSRLQGPWTDIYGLAATIYRALSGSAPPESTMRVLEDSCIPATELDLPQSGGYRPEFLAAVDHALAIMPKARPQSIAEWRNELLVQSSSRPRLLDANGDPTTVREWNPISDRSAEETIYDSPGISGGSRGSSSPSGSGATQGRSAATAGTTRHSAVLGTARSAGGSAAYSPASGAGTSASSPSGTLRPASAGIVNKQSQPVGNRTFIVGVALFAAGGLALAGQWFMARKSSEPIQIAAPQQPAGISIDDNRRQRELERQEEANRRAAEAAKQAAAEAAEKEAEKKRIAEAAEKKRLADEAERQRLADEAAERRRVADEAEKKRIAEAAEKKRLADEAERQRLADEAAERRRVAEEAEKKRLAEAAEKKRLADEAERQRLADEAAARRRAAEEAEKKRLAEVAEKKRLADEAERQRLADEAAARRRAAEEAERAEKKRLADETERKRLADEAERKRQLEVEIAAREQERPSGTELAATGGAAAGSDPRLSPLTGNYGSDEGTRRIGYLKNMQAALQSSKCYDGALNGDAAATRDALSEFEKGYDGKLMKIDVASASSDDFERWLGWFWRQKSFSCSRKQAPDTSADDAAERAREAREERQREREERKSRADRYRVQKSAPKSAHKAPKATYKAPKASYSAPKSYGSSGGSSRNDMLRGGR